MFTVQHMYQDLQACCECLQKDVERSLQDINSVNFDLNKEDGIDRHYKEILHQLQQIKEHIKIIATHQLEIQVLEGNKRNSVKIDRNYIKKQVETFQNLDNVSRRERKPVRPPETSSMKLLECWVRFLEEHESNESEIFPSVVKRQENLRKKKRVSSTVDTLLESQFETNNLLEAVQEDLGDETIIEEDLVDNTITEDAVNVDIIVPDGESENLESDHEGFEAVSEEELDHKPRIVHLVLKKDIGLH